MRKAHIALLMAFSVLLLPASSPYYGVEIVEPHNGAVNLGIDGKTFSWRTWNEANKYELQLAEDLRFDYMVVTAILSDTTYAYSGKLQYSTTYFWRVRALDGNGWRWNTPSKVPSDWSMAFFITEDAPAEPLPPPAPPKPFIPPTAWIASGAACSVIILAIVISLIRKSHRRRLP
jgi:hypothetical protein